jgi:hypothetical protein
MVGVRPEGWSQTQGGFLTGTPTEGELAAVLSALAGVRKGDLVAAVGCGRIVEASLAAGSGLPLLDGLAASGGAAKVVVVGRAVEVAGALRLLAPGGRFVAVAADPGAAARVAVGAGLELRHVERLGAQVAWSAVRPAGP